MIEDALEAFFERFCETEELHGVELFKCLFKQRVVIL